MREIEEIKIKEKLKELITDYVDNGEDLTLERIVSLCNGYDSGLDDYYYWNNDEEFYEIMFESKDEVARAVYYASDYCYTDEYIKLNVYGNCETISEYEYRGLLEDNKEEIIEEYIAGLYRDFGYFICEIEDSDLREEIERYVRCEENE